MNLKPWREIIVPYKDVLQGTLIQWLASRDGHSGASSLTRRVTGPAAPWPLAAASSIPSREGGSDSTRPMASRDGHSSASSFTRRVTGPAARWPLSKRRRF